MEPVESSPASEPVAQPVEGQAPEAPEAPKVAEGANRFAFLAKKEAAIVKQRHELKSQMQALESQKSEVEKLRAEIEAAKGRKSSYRSNPLAALEDAGLTYKELTDFILNNNTVSTESQIKALQDKIDQVEAQRVKDAEAASLREKQQAEAREAQVINEFKAEIANHVSSNKDEYELTNLYDSIDLVYDTVEAYFDKTNKVLSIPEAAALVEKYLERQVEKSLQTKKLSAKLRPSEPEPTARPDPQAQRRTLSNNQYTSSTPSMVSPKVENDRMARAMAALDQ